MSSDLPYVNLNKRDGGFLLNLLTNLLNMVVSLAIGFILTPYLLRHLGAAIYGIVPLSNTVISYMSIATMGLNIAVNRHLTIALEKNDYLNANIIFNTSVFGSIFATLLLIFPLCLFIIFADKLLNIPQGTHTQVRCLLVFSAISFLINTITTAFGVSTFYCKRFDIRNYFNIASTISRASLVVILFTYFIPNVIYVGVAMLLGTLVLAIGAVWAWRYLTPQLTVSHKLTSKNMFWHLTDTAGWIVISQLGTILLISIDLLVANILLGPVTCGKYAIVLQWSEMLRSIGANISGLFAPNITRYYANNNMDGLVAYARKSVKFMGLLLGYPVGLIAGFSSPLLKAWVGFEHADLAPLMILLILPLSVNLAYLPLHHISVATNNVRIPGIVQVVLGLLNLLLAVLFVKFTSLGMYGIALAGTVILTFRNIIFTPLYASHILSKGATTFTMEIVPCVISSLTMAAICYIISNIFCLNNWLKLFMAAIVPTFIYALVCFKYLLSEKERNEIKEKTIKAIIQKQSIYK